jgi:ubiquinone biosynthesis protein UbiJ
MATQSPFSMLESILQSFNLPVTPPAWAIDETHRRIVLLLNHVLMQEPQAMERLVRQKGRIVLMQWRAFTFRLLVTPAGLFDVAAPDAQADLLLVITQESLLSIAQELMQGGKPSVRIEGDVQLAAEVSWLIDHVRWDIEEDLARILGDAPAHAVVQLARTVAQAVQQFVGQRGRDGAGGSSA